MPYREGHSPPPDPKELRSEMDAVLELEQKLKVLKESARVSKEIVAPDHRYTLISLEELEGPMGITKAKRSNCVLDCSSRKLLGIEMPALDHERLREIMRIYKEQLQEESLKLDAVKV